jgi:hypothetical protein
MRGSVRLPFSRSAVFVGVLGNKAAIAKGELERASRRPIKAKLLRHQLGLFGRNYAILRQYLYGHISQPG